MVMDSRMEREQLKTAAVSSQRARYSIVSNTAVGYGSMAPGRFSLAVCLLNWCAS